MMQGHVEHPADFEKDAVLFGGLTITQLFLIAPAVAVGVLANFGLLMRRPLLWEWYSVAISLAVTIYCLEISHRLRRRITLATVFALRPRWRRSDASKPVTAHSNETVQDLVKVQACSGPFVQFLDGSVAMVLRITPPPSVCASPQQEETVRLRFQKVLKRAAQAGAEVMIYQEVEPDLNRSEIDRNLARAERLLVEAGLRRLVTERQHYHGEVATEWGRRVAYHIRLAIRPEQALFAATAETEAERTEAVLTHLRDIGMGIAGEIGHDGVKVQPLGPEGVRNLMARQLDPAGWLMSEPVRGTDWAWAAGGDQPVIGAPTRISDQKEACGHVWTQLEPGHTGILGALASATVEAAAREAVGSEAQPVLEPVQRAPQPRSGTVTSFMPVAASQEPVQPLQPTGAPRQTVIVQHSVGVRIGPKGFPMGYYRRPTFACALSASSRASEQPSGKEGP